MIFLYLCSFYGINAQNDSLKTKAVLIELGGLGGYASLNFEHKFFNKQKSNFSYRIAFGTYKWIDFEEKFNPELIFPLSFSYYYGKKHQIELGTGLTFVSIPVAEDFEKKRQNSISGHFILAYRLETNKNWIYKIAFTPMFEKEKGFRPWFGLSFGKKIF
ncbi:MAG: hypothetical protein ACK5B9_13125 [Flavobacteriia bacterium]|jgi:hypothetical protein